MRAKKVVPAQAWRALRRGKHAALSGYRRAFEAAGLVVSRKRDFYAPGQSEADLRQTRGRWAKPSDMAGVQYDLPAMAQRLASLCEQHLGDFLALPPYAQLVERGFGPGYPQVDAFCLFAMMRTLRPKRYLEVGSGLSTFYAHTATQHNARDGAAPTQITCVEPFPYPALATLPSIALLEQEVQDVPLARFGELEAGDVLFIDSSHIVRIDGDVPFLVLEVLPRLSPGVVVHIHDIPFPFNVPYPPDYWTTLEHPEAPHWPMFWNEAMLVQALLSGNRSFELHLSCPLLRHHDEALLTGLLPFYEPVSVRPDTFSSLWLKKVA